MRYVQTTMPVGEHECLTCKFFRPLDDLHGECHLDGSRAISQVMLRPRKSKPTLVQLHGGCHAYLPNRCMVRIPLPPDSPERDL